jgi:hypothetical protein
MAARAVHVRARPDLHRDSAAVAAAPRRPRHQLYRRRLADGCSNHELRARAGSGGTARRPLRPAAAFLRRADRLVRADSCIRLHSCVLARGRLPVRRRRVPRHDVCAGIVAARIVVPPAAPRDRDESLHGRRFRGPDRTRARRAAARRLLRLAHRADRAGGPRHRRCVRVPRARRGCAAPPRGVAACCGPMSCRLRALR